MRAVAIIPARYASTRLPGKPLLADTGKPLIQHVVEAVRPAKLIERVIVATDDERIAAAAGVSGAEAVMTAAHHRTGTDRIAEAAGKLNLPHEQIVVNVQGDEPDISPDLVDRLVESLTDSGADVATLAAPLPASEADDPNKVKVVCTAAGEAMYFSRAAIPFDREGAGGVRRLLHLGVYACRVGFLRAFAAMPPTPAEAAEKLEQLRVLETGGRIAVAVVDYSGSGIDTPKDYAAFVARMKAEHQTQKGPP